ncbi:hypothetical protein [Anaeromicrobium sediminis]|uniref:hypothetical protein n=1 Tax=Anaeromicrobium sediminis TaxID=1478221 RepID=UPI0011402C2E|nr:hypothetical protein [Anaeromicrobium sediminis]
MKKNFLFTYIQFLKSAYDTFEGDGIMSNYYDSNKSLAAEITISWLNAIGSMDDASTQIKILENKDMITDFYRSILEVINNPK